jgi:hypothetical protein
MSKTFSKLREVIVGYSLPSSILGKSFIKKIEVSFGKADLKGLSNINLEFKYSKVTIGSLTGNCKLKFSNLKSEKEYVSSNREDHKGIWETSCCQ